MKQDLQLTFLDILGYVFPGGLLVYVFLVENKIFEEPVSTAGYFVIVGFGYVLGHILLFLGRKLVSWPCDLICGHRQKATLGIEDRRLTLFARKLLGLRMVDPEFAKEIIESHQDKSTSAILNFYFWKVSTSSAHFNHERRLRAFTILFNNLTIVLPVIALFYFENTLVAITLITLSVLSFFSYCRYRLFRINYLYHNGYFLDTFGDDSE